MSEPSALGTTARRLEAIAAELERGDLTQDVHLALAEEAVALSERVASLVAEELRRSEA